MGQRIGRIVADRSDVSEMVVKPLQFQEKRAEVAGTSGNLDVQKRFHCLAVRQTMSYGRISGYPFCERNRSAQRLLFEQFFDPTVFPKVADFELHDRLAGDREAEMSWFDDAGMDRPDGHFEDTLSLDVTKAEITLLPADCLVPKEILLQGMRSLGPVLMPNQAA